MKKRYFLKEYKGREIGLPFITILIADNQQVDSLTMFEDGSNLQLNKDIVTSSVDFETNAKEINSEEFEIYRQLAIFVLRNL